MPTIREYRDEDDAACKALEMRAMQGGRYPRLQNLMRFFIRAGFAHYSGFDAKARQYEDCAILVAEDDEGSGSIVGVICAAIKACHVRGAEQKVGYIFDLRVHEEYQGRKIGSQLSNAIEQECIQKGCTLLYLSVNRDNVKANSLYRKHGWVHASPRSPSIDVLISPVRMEDPTVMVEKVTTAKAVELTEQGHRHADMRLRDMNALFGSDLYEGTFVARRGGSYAGISLWNGSSLGGIKVDRLVLPVGFYQTAAAGVLAKALAACGASYWLLSLYVALEVAFRERSLTGGRSLRAALLTLGTAAAGYALIFKVRPFILFAGERILWKTSPGPPKLRQRLFGPFAHGDPEEQETLMKVVLKHVHNVAREGGYCICICNLDKEWELRPAFPESKFETTLLQKSLSGGSPPGSSDGDVGRFTKDNFFDPRDI